MKLSEAQREILAIYAAKRFVEMEDLIYKNEQLESRVKDLSQAERNNFLLIQELNKLEKKNAELEKKVFDLEMEIDELSVDGAHCLPPSSGERE